MIEWGVPRPRTRIQRLLDLVERVMPDPAVLFLLGMLLPAAELAACGREFCEIDPRTVSAAAPAACRSSAQPAERARAGGLPRRLVKTFTDFHPLGIVLARAAGCGRGGHRASSAPASGPLVTPAGCSRRSWAC
jgi:p-aminobenzoyl-glutamate transporter AbgT